MDSKEKKEKGKTRVEVYDWIQSILAALVMCVLLFVFGVRMVNVDGSSMYPTLEDGDRVLISNLFYTPKQGDIVVLRKESFMYEPIVKRVIAVEGQTIEFDFTKGIVKVDGVELDEPYINELTLTSITCPDTVTVPDGCVFVMGDNRNASTDSRLYEPIAQNGPVGGELGCVDTRYIQGRVYVTLFPLKNFGWEAQYEGTFAS